MRMCFHLSRGDYLGLAGQEAWWAHLVPAENCEVTVSGQKLFLRKPGAVLCVLGC